MILLEGIMKIRLAHPNEVSDIMTIIDQARAYIASYGSDQWQNGYPDADTIIDDIISGQGYVALVEGQLAGYTALVKGPEKAYNAIYDGKWLIDNQDYIAFHRIAVADAFRRQQIGLTMLEGLMEMRDETDFRCDTHPDNKAMNALLNKLGFAYCGKVMFEGERLAYQLIKTEKNRAPLDYILEGGD